MGMPNIVNSRKRLELLYTMEGICPEFYSSEKNKRCPHSGVGTLPVPSSNTDRLANCLDVECACQSSAAGARDDCKYVSTHSGVACTRTYTIAHISEQPDSTVIATRVETPSGIVISLHEIDNEKADTFPPFFPEQTQSDTSLIKLEEYLSGTESQIEDIKRLCRKYTDIFSDKLPAKPAKLPSFQINTDKRLWHSPKNRTAVRLQSVRKEREIKRFIDEMLLSGIIEKPNAVYYSHPVIVRKIAELFRFCIDYRLLNKCTDASSWPLPNIRALLERVGHYKPDTFEVMDLISRYDQAPMDAASKVLTAFICYSGVYQFTRLPFGPRGGPSYFQEMMTTVVLNRLIYTKCEIHLDDCTDFVRGHDELLERLGRFFLLMVARLSRIEIRDSVWLI